MPRDYVKEGYKEGDTFLDNGKMVILQPDGTVRDATIKKAADPSIIPPAPEVPSTIPGVFNTEAGKKFAAGRPTYVSPTGNQSDTSNNNPEYNAGIKYNSDGTRVLSSAEQEIANYYANNKPKTPSEIAADEDKIRQDRLIQQQQAITSINSMYDNLLNQINKDNSSRLGSAASINALSGNRGSASGLANESNVRTANQRVIDANEAERTAKISQIMNDYKNQISDEITKARELRTKDANAYLAYKAGEIDRNKATASDLRAKLIGARLKPEDIDEETYKQIGEAGGYTADEAKILYTADYNQAVKDFAASEAAKVAASKKAAAEVEKTQAETEKLKADANAKSDENLLINKGYVYVSTPAQRDQLISEGRIVTERNGKTYVAPNTVKTKVITRGSNNILIDSTTGDDIKDLGPTKTPAGNGSTKNYTATTIPADIKKDLLYDKQTKKADLDTLLNAYPEVSTSYIQSLFANPERIKF